MAVISAKWGFSGAVRPCGGQSILICTLSSTRYYYLQGTQYRRRYVENGYRWIIPNIMPMRIPDSIPNAIIPAATRDWQGLFVPILIPTLYGHTEKSILSYKTRHIWPVQITRKQFHPLISSALNTEYVHTILRTPYSYNINLLPIRAAYRCPIHRMITYGKIRDETKRRSGVGREGKLLDRQLPRGVLIYGLRLLYGGYQLNVRTVIAA